MVRRKLELSKEAYQYSLVYWTRINRLSVAKAAAKLKISPHTAANLLDEAYDADLVETAFKGAWLSPEGELSTRVSAYCQAEGYGIRDTWVLPSFPFDQADEFHTLRYTGFLRMELGRLAARYINERCGLQDGDHLAVGGGRTMFAFAESFRTDKRLVIRPLALGGKWRAMAHADAATVLQVILAKHTEVGRRRPEEIRVICPEGPARGVAAVREYPEVSAVFGKAAPRPKVTVMSIGRVEYESSPTGGAGVHTSTYVRLLAESLAFQRLCRGGGPGAADIFGALDRQDYEEAWRKLRRARVVTDICRFGVRADGSVVTGLLDETSLAVHPTTLRGWVRRKTDPTTSILALGGSRLVDSLKAALSGGYFNVLIIDAALALALLPQRRWPRAYLAFADA